MPKRTINLGNLGVGKGYSDALLEEAALNIVRELQQRSLFDALGMLKSVEEYETAKNVTSEADHRTLLVDLKRRFEVYENRCTRFAAAVKTLKSAIDTKP